MDEIDTLIRELEEATEGSRKLDEKIHKSIGDPGADDPRLFAFEHGDYPPHYTTSLDAALAAVPEGYGIENFMIWPGEPSTVMLVGTHLRDGRYWHEAGKDGRWRAEAATPALALSLADLKARRGA